MACLSPPEYHMFLEDREYQMTAFLFLAPRQIAGIDYISHYQKKKVNCLFSIIFQKKKRLSYYEAHTLLIWNSKVLFSKDVLVRNDL